MAAPGEERPASPLAAPARSDPRAAGAGWGPTYNGPPCDRPTATPADSTPRGRSSPEAARARARGARALARSRGVRAVAADARRGAAMGLLRGPSDRERPAGLPPRAVARLQGHLPALSDDARPPRGAQGGLGLPRAAGGDRRRREARDLLEGRDRAGNRHRAVQRRVPCVGVRLSAGVEPADRADRILAGPRAPLSHARRELHRVGLVGSCPDRRARPPVRGPQGRALLPALRDDAFLARGRARL